jgi:hypothetical protein
MAARVVRIMPVLYSLLITSTAKDRHDNLTEVYSSACMTARVTSSASLSRGCRPIFGRQGARVRVLLLQVIGLHIQCGRDGVYISRHNLILGTLAPCLQLISWHKSSRRHQFLAALTNRLRRRPAGSGRLVPLDEIVGSLGWRSQRQLGLQTIRLDTIAGTAGARRDFDRCFRPTSGRVWSRWERLALAQRRGEAIPPIEVYRVGHRHFVSDGHHRYL